MSDTDATDVAQDGTRARVGMATFIREWEGSESVREVSEKTGLKETSCYVRFANYRKKGIPLKRMKGKKRGAYFNVEDAQALLEQIRAEQKNVITEATPLAHKS
ncbi:hypothetical protein LCGC14_1588930 [marine sediment metagenome]|uniref:Uncharacterized protein n=1 Tax=marine sediment metagenome TaxID=412755 RepID=A0A0F9KVD6_9ZZZZ